MSKYVDADDVLEFLNLIYDNQEDKDDPYNVGVMGAINYIKHKAPTIEIIRCRECIHYGRDSERNTYGCNLHSIGMTPSDFCSYGERKEQ